MKTLIIAALAGVSALGAAASADPPGRFAPPQFLNPAGSGTCALRVEGRALIALAAPWNARDWSLSVRAPELSVDQGGDLYGDSRRMERLSRIYMVDTIPQPGRVNAQIDQESVLKRPLRADLTVTGHDGRVVCTDSVNLTPEPRRGRFGRPF